MAEGFIQVAPDSTGKQLDNDVITVPAGTQVTDGSGNVTTLAAPAFYFRERVVSADPNNPLGVATVTRSTGPNVDDYGLTVRVPPGQSDLQTIASILLDIDTLLATQLGLQPLTGLGIQPLPTLGLATPTFGGLPPSQSSTTVPRGIISDIFGRQVIIPHTIRDLVVSAALTITASTSETPLIPASGDPTVCNDVVGIIGVNTSGTATRVDIRDQLSTVATPASQNGVIPLYLPAGDMRGISLGGVIIKQTNPNQLWTATANVSVTDVRLWALYIKNKTQ